MKKQNFILAFFGAALIGISVQPALTQRVTRSGKHKMITLPAPAPKPPPKQLSIEVKVKGSGYYQCERPVMTCTWSIDRQYSGTVKLDDFIKLPFTPMTSAPGTASAIGEAKIAALAKANPAAAYNSKWFTAFNPQKMFFEVKVSINDEVKVSWKERNKANQEETKTITQTWTSNRTGKGVNYLEVVLDRQLRAFKLLYSLDSDAQMTYRMEKSWDEELQALPEDQPVFRLPEIEDYLQGQVILPLNGETPADVAASFEQTFSDLRSRHALLNQRPETTAASISVTYKFR